ncbi:MAG TPA: GNAT family N-acetyltransferase [Jatrophihabitans sp.]
MTFVRPVPATARGVDVLGTADRLELDRLVAADPIVNSVVAARLAIYRSPDPVRLGGVLLGARDTTGVLTGAAFNGGNLIPIGGTEADWTALAEQVAGVRRVCTSIVGPFDAVAAMWAALEPRWGPARAIRERQPLLAVTRSEPRRVPRDRRVRVMHPDELERYLPAAAAMFTEELGISPFAGHAGTSYRRRVETLLANGRAFGIVDDDGQMVFKADIGALTRDTCQVQGVWVRPDLRGQGIGTHALAAVLDHALRLAPSASLYVNDYNHAARRMYATLGMRQVSVLKTVLF